MEIILNDKTHEIQDPSLLGLIEHYCSGKTAGIAVAVNHQVVPRQSWQEKQLREKDSVLIIKATQGG